MKRVTKAMVVLSLCGMTSSFIPGPISKGENQMDITHSNVLAEKVDTRTGFHGMFFKNADFSDLAVLGQTDNGTFGIDLENFTLVGADTKVQSFIWTGVMIPAENIQGTLSVSTFEDVSIEVNGVLQEENQVAAFQKGQEIKLRIEATSATAIPLQEVSKATLMLNKEIVISSEELFLPDYATDEWKGNFMKQEESFVHPLGVRDEWTDTDGDSIPDKWEREGYTIQAKKAVPWRNEYAALGYTKFTSNPYEAHTVGDPYTDLQKATRDIPQSNAEAANHPLVAAYPNISMTVEKMQLSPNLNLSNAVTSNNRSDYTIENVRQATSEDTWAGHGPRFEISKKYYNGDSTDAIWGDSVGTTSQISAINQANTAYLNAQVRYKNIGTGAIYEVQPKTRFFIGDDQVASLSEKANPNGLDLQAHDAYPKISQPGILMNTFSDMNNLPIQLNKQQKDDFITGNLDLTLHTEQVYGKYPVKLINGNSAPGEDWKHVIHQIENHTASIMLDLGTNHDHASNIRVAGKRYNNPEDHTPELTLGEALLLAYPDEVEMGKDGIPRFNGISIAEGSMNIYTNEETARMINKQLSDTMGIFKDVNYLYQVKMEPKMEMTLRRAGIYESFEGNQNSFLLNGGTLNNPDFNTTGPSGQSMSGYYRLNINGIEEIQVNANEKRRGEKLYFSDELLKEADKTADFKMSYYRKEYVPVVLPKTSNYLVPIYQEINSNSEVYLDPIRFSVPENASSFYTKQWVNLSLRRKNPSNNKEIKLVGFWIDNGMIDDFSVTKVPNPQ